MPASSELIRRSGELKRQMREFAEESTYRDALQQAFDDRFGKRATVDEGELIDFFNHFLLEYKLPDGRTMVEHFVEAHPELPAAEREMLLGWRDVFLGMFEVQRRDGHALIVENLVDDMIYRVHSNMGPAALFQFPPKSFFLSRLVPVGDEWLLSGGQYRLPPSARVQACQIAAELAQGSPKLVFRNPKKLEQVWEAQWRERQRFISFFGSDQVVIPGRELFDRMKAFRRFDAYEVRDTDGLSDMERIKRSYGVEPPLPEWNFPDDLVEAETVGVIYDEVEGLNFFPDFGLVEEAFVRPELVKDDAHREVVLGYLRSTGIMPLPLLRLAERDRERATWVFQVVLDDPNFAWDRDGEVMLRRYKAEHFERKPRPCITPVSSRLAQAQLGLPSPRGTLDNGRRTGRNDPCPCGSGMKYKKCCGR